MNKKKLISLFMIVKADLGNSFLVLSELQFMMTKIEHVVLFEIRNGKWKAEKRV